MGVSLRKDDVNDDILVFTINAFFYVYNVKTIHKIVISFFENLHY